MGCFCSNVALPPIPAFDASLSVLGDVSLVAAVSEHLALRWLPPAIPWRPDPAWLDLRLPTLPMPQASLSVLLSLVLARQAILLTLKLDVLVAADLLQLRRIVATLNLRTDLLASLTLDWRPWLPMANLLHQVTTVQAAAKAGVFVQETAGAGADLDVDVNLNLGLASPLAPPWRALLVQVKALAPLVAIAAALKLDLSEPGWVEQLALVIRPLRLVLLPLLAAPAVVLQAVAQVTARAQLQAAFGALPFPQLHAALMLRLQAVLRLLPPGLRVTAGGQLLGMPHLLPNPSLILNAPTVQAVARLTATATARLNWQVPVHADLTLLTVGSPLAALVAGWPSLGLSVSPIRLTPCNMLCDAAKALKALA